MVWERNSGTLGPSVKEKTGSEWGEGRLQRKPRERKSVRNSGHGVQLSCRSPWAVGSVGRALSRNEDRKSADCKGLACNQSHFLSLRRQQLPTWKSPIWEGHWLPVWIEKGAQEAAVEGQGLPVWIKGPRRWQWAVGSEQQQLGSWKEVRKKKSTCVDLGNVWSYGGHNIKCLPKGPRALGCQHGTWPSVTLLGSQDLLGPGVA